MEVARPPNARVGWTVKNKVQKVIFTGCQGAKDVFIAFCTWHLKLNHGQLPVVPREKTIKLPRLFLVNFKSSSSSHTLTLTLQKA